MSNTFRDLLRKVGSGPHTGKDLSREEAKTATDLMLLQEATPAQIGAFMIAHRIKRPTAEELAGILDAYDSLGPKLPGLPASPHPVTVLSSPYDGRSRTAPTSPLTALILATADCPVVMHGGDRMPTKYGIPLVEVWLGLGIDWRSLSLMQIQAILATTGLGFVYLPQHFPLAHELVPYRDQIGKRPPFATVELLWSPCHNARVVLGYVHPPTEDLAFNTFRLRGTEKFITVKGLEGSCDLPRDRTSIIGIHSSNSNEELERILLHPRDYGFAEKDVPLPVDLDLWIMMQSVLKGTRNELMQSAIWNAGFYLWQCGDRPDLTSGLTEAETLLTSGQVAQTLDRLKAAIVDMQTESLTPHAP